MIIIQNDMTFETRNITFMDILFATLLIMQIFTYSILLKYMAHRSYVNT